MGRSTLPKNYTLVISSMIDSKSITKKKTKNLMRRESLKSRDRRLKPRRRDSR